MPIEIRELVIKVNVNENAGSGASPPSRSSQSTSQAADRKAIVAECLEQVMDIIQKKKER